MKIVYTENVTKICDSYSIENVEDAIKEMLEERYKKKLPITRSLQSYVAETKAHNRLYKLGLFRSHTKDVDLEENISRWKEIVWFILGV